MTVHSFAMRPTWFAGLLAFAALAPCVGATSHDATLPGSARGRSWTLVEVAGPDALPHAGQLEEGTFWDLRPTGTIGRGVRWTVLTPSDAGLADQARAVGADAAVCETGSSECRLIHRGPVALGQDGVSWLARPGAAPVAVDTRAVAEGLALLPAGPREVVVLREVERGDATGRRSYRFVTRAGVTVAEIEGAAPDAQRPFTIERASVLGAEDAADGIAIPFLKFRDQLRPGSTGFLQYSAEADTPLTSIHPAWSSVAAMISIDQTAVGYQPDPGDPGSTQALPEVWDFTGLVAGNLGYRTFNSTRSDTGSWLCNACATRDTGPAPADGTWQSYLKIDIYGPGGGIYTQDYFSLNDNDTGANPSIDVPYVQFDTLNAEDRTQVCFAQSAGGANRLLRFFRFEGPDPASAVLDVGDTWTSGAWTECDNTNGLKLTLASVCGDLCWPECTGTDPRARGRLTAGAGFRMTAIEDGWVHVPAGNYVPAVLLRQDTDLLAGLDFIGVCVLGATPNRSFDYFWVNEHYGLLANVSSPTSETIAAGDWSAAGNVSDGVDFTWGPFPPYQIEAQACLAGTRLRWALPADGSNLTGAPGVTDYGYVVSWGSSSDAEALADWTTNPNHSPLPGEPGYLAAPAGSEPTSFVIQGWAPSAVQATVTTAVRYVDPNAGDQRAYRSAAFFKVAENPARLDDLSFRVGNGVVPFTSVSGGDVALSWPAVAGASSYRVRVWDLDTRTEVACPATLNCTPTVPSPVHVGGAGGPGSYGYSAYAVDACGAPSSN